MEIHPNFAKLMTILANIYFNKDNTGKFFEICKKAVNINSDFPQAWELLGKLTLIKD